MFPTLVRLKRVYNVTKLTTHSHVRNMTSPTEEADWLLTSVASALHPFATDKLQPTSVCACASRLCTRHVRLPAIGRCAEP